MDTLLFPTFVGGAVILWGGGQLIALLVGLPLHEVSCIAIVAPGKQVDQPETLPVQRPHQVGHLVVEIGLLGGHFLCCHDVIVVPDAVCFVIDVVGHLLGCLLFCIIIRA